MENAQAMEDRADLFWPDGNCMFAHYTLRFLDRQMAERQPHRETT